MSEIKIGRQVPASELRAVAEEMRQSDMTDGFYRAQPTWRQCRAWANRLDPPEPEPLKVGDRVKASWNDWSGTSQVIFIELSGKWALMQSSQGDKPVLRFVSDLERIP